MIPKVSYTPENWYWVVTGNTTQVYSSAVGDYVSLNDPAYVAWLAEGNVASKTKDEVTLGVVLAGHGLRPVPAAILDSFKEAQAKMYTPADVTPKVIHFVYNEVRALQSKPPLTFEQFRQAIKDRM